VIITRKSFVIGGALALALLILVVVVRMIPWRRTGENSGPPLASSPAPTDPMAWLDDQDVPPEPSVSLQINALDELDVLQGTPLIFSVRMANPRAANAASTNDAHQRDVDFAGEQVTRGALSAAAAEPVLALARRRREVRAVSWGSPDHRWETFLYFDLQPENAPSQRLSWAVTPVAVPQAASVTLDATSTIQIDHALAPAGSAAVAPGEYLIAAVLDIPPDVSLPAGQWHGRVVSSTVHLTIRSAVQPSPADTQATELRMAEFFSTTKDWNRAIEHAQRVIVANPTSIPAHIVIGDAKEAQGDLPGALDAYKRARQFFSAQFPDSDEAPRYLDLKIASLAGQDKRPAR